MGTLSVDICIAVYIYDVCVCMSVNVSYLLFLKISSSLPFSLPHPTLTASIAHSLHRSLPSSLTPSFIASISLSPNITPFSNTLDSTSLYSWLIHLPPIFPLHFTRTFALAVAFSSLQIKYVLNAWNTNQSRSPLFFLFNKTPFFHQYLSPHPAINVSPGLIAKPHCLRSCHCTLKPKALSARLATGPKFPMRYRLNFVDRVGSIFQ